MLMRLEIISPLSSASEEILSLHAYAHFYSLTTKANYPEGVVEMK